MQQQLPMLEYLIVSLKSMADGSQKMLRTGMLKTALRLGCQFPKSWACILCVTYIHSYLLYDSTIAILSSQWHNQLWYMSV